VPQHAYSGGNTEVPDRGIAVLIVDDSPTDALMFQRLVTKRGRSIHVARTGAEACRIAAAQDLAVIILDVQMPEMDGYDTAEALRSIPGTLHTPIIFVTATHCEEEHVFRGYDSGAVDYLLKPVPPRLLKSKVDVFCELYVQRTLIEDHLAEIQLQKAILERQLTEIKVLRGLVPLCVSCKKVRDDSGYWEAIETYLQDRSEAEFSHAVCPECSERLYPEFYDSPK
jgi:CheY-like chemotaxis protein